MEAVDEHTGLPRASTKCPICGEPAVRISRLPIDRFKGYFKPNRRYKCTDTEKCTWQGTLKVRGSSKGRKKNAWRKTAVFVAIAIILCVAAGMNAFNLSDQSDRIGKVKRRSAKRDAVIPAADSPTP